MALQTTWLPTPALHSVKCLILILKWLTFILKLMSAHRQVVLTATLLLGIHNTSFLRFYFFTLIFVPPPSFFFSECPHTGETQQIKILSVSMHHKPVVPWLDPKRSPVQTDWHSQDSISPCARLCVQMCVCVRHLDTSTERRPAVGSTVKFSVKNCQPWR